LEIPAEVQVERPRNFFRGLAPRLAIAATIALALLGLGVWLGLQRFGRVQPVAVSAPNKSAVSVDPTPAAVPSPDEKLATSPGSEQNEIQKPRQQPDNQPLLAGYSSRHRHQPRNAALQNRLLAAKQEKEAEAAKDQLMLALRVVSAKLNYAQKKAQSPNPRDLIHNQHKIG
jgi:hypothetical protein